MGACVACSSLKHNVIGQHASAKAMGCAGGAVPSCPGKLLAPFPQVGASRRRRSSNVRILMEKNYDKFAADNDNSSILLALEPA